MADATEQQAPPMWRDAKVKVESEDVAEAVPALVTDRAPGLAVTMLSFGRFDVTHVPSGRRIAGSWQRFGAACVILARLARLTDWTQDVDAVREAVQAKHDEPVPFDGATVTSAGETRPMTVQEYMRSLRGRVPIVDEFPWEAPSDDPFALACDLLADPDPKPEAQP